MTLPGVCLELAKESIPDTWKENWWVNRYAWLCWVPITVFGMLFRGCCYSVRLLSVLREQSNFKYQWITTWNIYKRNVSEDRLSPTFSRRVNCQICICKSAWVPALNLPSSVGNGLQVEGLNFCKEFILNLSVPDAIVELTRYKCKNGCKTNSYSWKRLVLVCTDSW